jgi:glyoxylase-like metal-dependent hydrolase (beta-lactamase superfamily II)
MRAVMPRQVASGVYQLELGGVNAFLVEDAEGGLWLIDTGIEPGAERIGGGIQALGRAPRELRGVVVTHLHGDHVGGLAAVKEHTGAEVWMSAPDAEAVRAGTRMRPLDPGPGLIRTAVVYAVRLRPERPAEPISVEHEIGDGDELPFDGTVVGTPGHTQGHISVLLTRDDGVLLTGDAATNWGRLGVGPIYEDVAEGMQSLRRLCGLSFETALFAHGRPIVGGASARFCARFAAV